MPKNIPQVTESTKFNFLTSIWIVPIIALFIAGWLAFQYFDDLGPEIKIIFPKNEGLVAGQSVVKFKNVPIGKVTKIYLDEEVNGVIVVVRMFSEKARPYMTEKAKFWIVKPEVGLSGVSGLDTLLSGTYIDVYSEKGGTFVEEHYGLVQPYHDSSKGTYYHLNSLEGKNVSVGTPIYYKSIEVGKVEHIYFGLDNKSVDVIIFIQNEYVPYVHMDSRFWVKNMINIDFTKGNLDVDIAPLNYMISGGILFSSSGSDNKNIVPNKHVFTLFKSKTEAENKTIGATKKKNKKFILLTDESLANLSIDALVRFDGFDIGRVLDIKLSYDRNTHNMLGQILLEIDTSVFEDKHDINITGVANFYAAVEEGLRAKIAALDPITGALFVDLTFNHQDGASKIVKIDSYPRLPMTSNSSTGMMDSVSQILDKLNNLPFEKLLDSMTEVVESASEPIANANDVLVDLKKTVANINTLTSKKSFEVLPDELSRALIEMTKTLKSTRTVVRGYGNDSLMQKQLTETLKILTKTSVEMSTFLKMLNRKPNSLIFGDN
jgi:paraquat-inducible protein B